VRADVVDTTATNRDRDAVVGHVARGDDEFDPMAPLSPTGRMPATAAIPPQPEGTMVYFKVQATNAVAGDGDGRAS